MPITLGNHLYPCIFEVQLFWILSSVFIYGILICLLANLLEYSRADTTPASFYRRDHEKIRICGLVQASDSHLGLEIIFNLTLLEVYNLVKLAAV